MRRIPRPLNVALASLVHLRILQNLHKDAVPRSGYESHETKADLEGCVSYSGTSKSLSPVLMVKMNGHETEW